MNERVKITILMDNHADDGLMAEHGLSLWIEADDKSILFDTGLTDAWSDNARALGIDKASADIIALSHGHCDHTGGLPAIYRNGKPVQFYAHPAVVKPRYSIHGNTAMAIHMPRESMRVLDKFPGDHVHWVYSPVELTRHIGLTGPIPRDTDYEDTGGPFYLDETGTRQDLIDDDLSLWIKTEKGLVICTGCCHSGLVNTINHIRRVTGENRIRAIIGGLHLIAASPERLKQTVKALDSSGIHHLIPLHCTGEMATQYLQDALGDRVTPGMAGQVYRY